MVDLETRIVLDKFVPRDYQRDLMRKVFHNEFKRFIWVLPRRAGKDIMAFNIAIRAAIMEPQVVYYIWPQFKQARESLWDNITIEGIPVLDYVPKEIATFYQQEMKIRFRHNGSIIRFLGSMDYERLRGGNPRLCIFSEYAWQTPKAFDVVRPILAANGGKAIFISTPFGKNFFYTLIQQAEDWPEWDTTILTVEDTQHISPADLAREKLQMDEEFFKQEYMCSFDAGVTGAYYGRYVPAMYLEDRIGSFPYDPYRKVYTAWDIGMNDMTAILFLQKVGGAIHIIDCYQNKDRGLEHYIQVIEEKGYRYAQHILPHDIEHRSLSTGTFRKDKLLDAGMDVYVAPFLSFMDGIDAGRNLLPRIHIDEKKGAEFIKCLTAYRKEWDEFKQVYRNNPVRNWATHMADAYRYLAVSLDVIQDSGTTKEEIEKAYIRAAFGGSRIGPRELEEPFDVY